MQTGTKIRIFQFLSIIIIYFVATSELIYSSNYLELHDKLASEKANDYFRVANKYAIALGEEDEIGVAAWQYFQKEFVPEIFKTCGNGYFSIYQFEKAIYVPPKRTKWYHYVTREGSYKYLPYYEIVGFTKLDYRYKLINQNDGHLNVQLKIYGTNLMDQESYNLVVLSIDMDYSYKVINAIRSTDVGKGLAVFGHGKHPSALTCNYLKSNLGKKIE